MRLGFDNYQTSKYGTKAGVRTRSTTSCHQHEQRKKGWNIASFRIRVSYNFTRLRREEFMTTDTELKAIAALAITGLNNNPKKG